MNILNVSLYCILLYSATPSTSFQNSQHTYLFKNTILIKNLGVNRLAVTQGVLHPMRIPPHIPSLGPPFISTAKGTHKYAE